MKCLVPTNHWGDHSCDCYPCIDEGYMPTTNPTTTSTFSITMNPDLEESSDKLSISVGVTVPIILLLIVILVYCFICRKKRRGTGQRGAADLENGHGEGGNTGNTHNINGTSQLITQKKISRKRKSSKLNIRSVKRRKLSHL